MTRFKSQLNQFILFSLTIIFLGIFSSCEKEPNGLGLEILPGEDSLLIRIDSSAMVLGNTVKFESIIAYRDSPLYLPLNYIVGSYTNPVFGKTQSSLMLCMRPDSLGFSFGEGKVADSLVFVMKLDSLYSSESSDIEIKIWEVNKLINYKQTYYTNISEQEYKGSLIATEIVPYNDTIRLKLDSNLADKLLNIPPGSGTDTTDATYFEFLDHFKGLYVEISPLSPNGGYIQLDPWGHSSTHHTRLTLFYHSNTADTSFNYYTFRAINRFSHDYSGTTVEQALQNNEPGKKITYVQGLGGLGTQIKISDLAKWADLYPVSINKAELILPVEDFAGVPENLYPSQLFIKAYNPESNDFDYIEYGLGESFLNGTFDTKKRAYIFNIAKHVQKIANRNHNITPVQNTDFMIYADGYKNGRFHFNNVGLNFAKAKLNIVYSKQ